MQIFWTIFAGLLGLAFGSFLNVCLSRWPEGESVVKPRSRCRACGRTLTWWENVPVLSWLALRGRCRTCGSRIGIRYVLVELVVGGLWAYVTWNEIGTPTSPIVPLHHLYIALPIFALNLVFLWILVALAALDTENLWLPDFLTLGGLGLGFLFDLLLYVAVLPYSAWGGGFLLWVGKCIGSVIAAAALVLLIRWLYWLIRRKEGLGLGDAKLMAMLAAWLGLPGALLAFFIGVVTAALVAVGMLAIPKRDSESWATRKLPLGTFLCIGGIISSLWGQQILDLYLKWAGF